MKARMVIGVVFAVVLLNFTSARSQWIQTNGPSGGTARLLTTIGRYTYAGGLGLYRSGDNGQTWSPAMLGLSTRHVNALAGMNATLYAATDSGIFRSSDEGTSWSTIGITLVGLAGDTQANVQALAIMGSRMIAGVDQPSGVGGIFTSDDAGAHWTRANVDNDAILSFTVVGPTLYAVNYFNGITESKDSGINWTKVALEGGSVQSMAILGTTLLASTNSTFGTSLIRSTDMGSTWIPADTGLEQVGYQPVVLAVNGSEIFAGTPYGIFRSSDTGAHWTRTPASPTNTEIGALAVNEQGIFAGSYYGGVYHSSDSGASWVAPYAGMPLSEINCVAMDGGTLLAGTKHAGLFRSSDNGRTWIESNSGLGGYSLAWPHDVGVSSILVDGPRIFVSSYDTIYRSTDHGLSWSAASNGLSQQQFGAIIRVGSSLFTASAASGPRGDTSLVFRSTDNGDKWAPASFALPSMPYSYLSFDVRGMAALGSDIFVIVNDTVFRSSDNGNSWMKSSADFPLRAGLNSLVTIGSDLFIGTDNAGVFRSGDGGSHWISVNAELDSGTKVTALYALNSNIFLGTRTGVFFSTDNGESWNRADQGMGSDYVTSFTSDGKNLFAGTHGSSIWRRPLSEMIEVNAVAGVPSAKLEISAYPNPLSSTTTISFASPSSGYADISITDLLGREVALLFSGELNVGEHSFTWAPQAKACATPGVYECVVRMNGEVRTVAILVER